ncbi:ABC transporter permease subunit [Oculatella sp. LEGE 06141]|uniref:nickel/cobalt ABC transporter permease n=1 Tax=Oculatella sp. LEGE 06141 TaxID=1828648 RepID=UPI00187FCD11|nr:nickel/cobalt ABC transporter permease [Oculatella sp. LEGE 06141]MBE9178142.1 ABC transporter permease subunit [Oculatella sp. LEGE 06141]
MAILQRLLAHKLAWIGLGIILCVTIAAIFAPLIAPHDPFQVDLLKKLQSPGGAFPLGTDHLGRCILSRLIYGARISLSIAVAAMTLGVTLGLLAGMVAGYVGGKLDALIMRLCDVLLAFPQLILSLAIVGILGAGAFNIVIALSIAQWAWYARIMRSKVLWVKESNFVKAAIVSGTRSFPLMLKHVLPHAISEIIVLASLDLGVTILQISGLSFLGLGIQPPTPEWGAMINDGREFFRSEPGIMFYPGMMIFMTVLAFNLVGDALRDALDPRSSQRVKMEDLESKLQHQV